MNSMHWAYFVLGLIAYQLVKILHLAIKYAIIDHRQKKFIKLVNIRFPDRRDITFITIDSSDKKGLENIERDLRAKYGLEPEEEEDDPMVLRLPRRESPK
jgi:hypothetical protein